MTSRQPKLMWLPFDRLLKIWKECYSKGNSRERERLNELDTAVTARTKQTVKGHLFVQLTQQELEFLKNSYELEF